MQSVQTRTGAAMTVTFEPDHGEISTPAGDLCLQVDERALIVEVFARTAAEARILEARTARNLERFGVREGLTVCWTDRVSQPSPTIAASEG